MLIGIFYSQIVESSSFVSVLFREAISHPYISFFHFGGGYWNINDRDWRGTNFGDCIWGHTGKKFPMNMRAMRMVAEELFRDVVSKCDPFWENLPIRTDNFFSDLLIKA